MIKKVFLSTLFILAIFLMPACDTDVDINAEWEEITIVYGLLSQQDTIHSFRINKAYLGGNALEVAKIADSSSYKGALQVTLEGTQDGDVMQSIPVDTITISDKDTGMFYNPYMLIYQATALLNQDYSYSLKIVNTVSGTELNAETNLVESFNITTPPSGGKATFKRNFDTEMKWQNAKYAKLYEPGVRFHYFEIHAGTTDTIAKFVDWMLPSQTSNDLTGSGTVSLSINNNGFYNFLKFNIKPADFDGIRLAGTVDFFVLAAGVEYDTYMRVNGPSNSLVQDRPEYTNVENGYGLLSSRFSVYKNRRLHPECETEIINLDIGFVHNQNL